MGQRREMRSGSAGQLTRYIKKIGGLISRLLRKHHRARTRLAKQPLLLQDHTVPPAPKIHSVDFWSSPRLRRHHAYPQERAANWTSNVAHRAHFISDAETQQRHGSARPS